mmetsp:Transcript_23540/g.41713  ORF Transcript_23540/g.41713 Transcript_23540/m.41713 type:complete len:250 (-) Transcript_23540:2660-3409(-)
MGYYEVLGTVGLVALTFNKVLYKAFFTPHPPPPLAVFTTPDASSPLSKGGVLTLQHTRGKVGWNSPCFDAKANISPYTELVSSVDMQVYKLNSRLNCFRPKAVLERMNSVNEACNLKVLHTQPINYTNFIRLSASFKHSISCPSVLRFSLFKDPLSVNDATMIVSQHKVSIPTAIELDSDYPQTYHHKVRIEEGKVKDCFSASLFFRTFQNSLVTPLFHHPALEANPVHLGLYRDTTIVSSISEALAFH